MYRTLLTFFFFAAAGSMGLGSPVVVREKEAIEFLELYCLDCHDDASQKGDFNLERLLEKRGFDGSLMFENLLTGKMPPAKKEQPTVKERRVVLDWLAGRKATNAPNSFRRVSCHEFVHSVNDLL